VGGIAACTSPNAPASSQFTFAGTVTESTPTQSTIIAGASITVQTGNRAGTVATTGPDGRFSISGITGAFDVVVRATGYVETTVHLDGGSGNVTQTLTVKPVMTTIAETIGTAGGPRRAATSFYRNVHNDGVITVSRLYFYYSQDPTNPPTRTIEIWNGQQFLGSATINKQQTHDLDLTLRVPGGARYEIRILGGDWGAVTIESPS
jgi:hypothetical protein